MTGSRAQDAVAAAFQEERGRLVAAARRILGSPTDAEDAVQEAWLRLSGQDPATIDNLAAWLTTVVSRVCLDMLRARRARPAVPHDEPLSELVVTEDDAGTPEQDALLADSVGLALLVVLDSLGPDERLAFVLHDVFGLPFDEVGSILGKSTDAAKMTASRARRKVRGVERSRGARERQRAAVDAFLAAARDGDFAGLLRVLDPDVVWRAHTPHGVVIRIGATEVAAKAQQAVHARATARRVLVNGEPGIVVWGPNGTAQAVMSCTVEHGRIVEMVSVLDPHGLAVDLPATPA
ncbi:sigma-70 family RNA polymerase sigma factor [Promicromonospora sp. NPDC050880]|uniref:sigma-70 family RNA polymerase sigma factor n=1 Tax=Promicromonospora sp. NPDC050880 TaxID=3364406 RepID=UPI0037A48F89